MNNVTAARRAARERPLALAYTRVSTADQAENGASLDAQETTLRAEATRRGWDLEIVREEGKSAATVAKRPLLIDALERLDRGDADILLAVRLDRVSRSTLDFAAMYGRSEAAGWAIVFPLSGIDTSTSADNPFSRFNAQNQANIAELERGLISARTKEGMAQRIKDGLDLSALTRAGIARRRAEGWAPTAKNPDGNPIGRPRSIPDDVLERIASQRAAGVSLGKIATALNDDAIPTAHGGARWYPATVARAIRP